MIHYRYGLTAGMRALLCLGLVACSGLPGSVSAPRGVTSIYYSVNAQTPLVSRTAQDAGAIAQLATRTPAETLHRRSRSTQLTLSQIPFLYSAPDGQAYDSVPAPRALVMGMPADQCPVLIGLRGTAPEATAERVIQTALTMCHADLSQRGLQGRCGCQLIAHDDILRVAQDRLGYAIRQTARLFYDGHLSPTHYFAYEEVEPSGRRGLHISTANDRLILSVRYEEDVDATVTFADGSTASAQRRIVGFYRGRLVQAITTQAPDGQRLRLILGP